MAAKKRFGKIKIVLIALSVVLLAALLVYYVGKYRFINSKVSEMVVSQTDSLYKITYDSISINEANGDLFVYNLSIKGDTARQIEWIKTGNPSAANLVVQAFVPILQVTGFKTSNALVDKQLSCSNITIHHPKIMIYVFEGVAKKEDISLQGIDLYKKILGKFTQIQADTVLIDETEVIALDFGTKQIKFQTYNTSLRLSDLKIDSTYRQDTSRTLFCRQINLRTDKVVFGNQQATTVAEQLFFDTKSKIFSLDKITHNTADNNSSFNGTLQQIKIRELKAKGPIDALNMIFGKIEFVKAGFVIKPKPAVSKVPAPPVKLLTGWVKSIAIRSLSVGDISVKILPVNNGAPFEVSKSALQVEDLFVDTTSLTNHTLIKSIGSLSLSNQLISFVSKDNLYRYNFSGLNVNTKAKTIKLGAFSIVPLLGEVAFARQAKVQRDRYDMALKNITCNGVDFSGLLQGNIRMNSINMANSFLRVYRDLSYPADGIKKVGKYPHQALYKIPVPLFVGNISAANTFIQYREKTPLTNSTGTLTFDRTNLKLANVTNAARPANNVFTMQAATQVLGQIPMRVTFNFYLQNISEGNFRVSGATTQSFNASVLNAVATPLAGIRIDKGIINTMDFDFQGNNTTSRGKFNMTYDDFKIALLRKGDNAKDKTKKGVFSLLANMVVKNANPAGKNLRHATVLYERDQYKSFFNMIWKSIFDGMKNIMGLKF